MSAHINRLNSVQGVVRLTGSKSESNRALILHYLSGGSVRVENLSSADDTQIMIKALDGLGVRARGAGARAGEDRESVFRVDVGPAGTAMRFLTALLSLVPGRFEISGTERMHQRPIALLVDALRLLGAHIEYLGRDGFPPLSISGSFAQISDEVTIPGDISSQYLSALLLIAPALPQGLKLRIKGQLTSRPYLTMTLDMLAESGVTHTWQENTITIKPQKFTDAILRIEPDWSAASYWYSFLALAPTGALHLPGLKNKSLQGDRAIAELMTYFGIQTTFDSTGIKLEKTTPVDAPEIIDCTEFPDLAQTLIVCAAAKKMNLSFTGLHTLQIKETDRVAALQNELKQFGVEILQEGEIYHLRAENFTFPDVATIKTYEDHRMAMAFAPLSVLGKINILDPQVVEKSYPDFWKDIKMLGISED